MKNVINNSVCVCKFCDTSFEFTRDEIRVRTEKQSSFWYDTRYYKHSYIECPVCNCNNILKSEQIGKEEYELNNEKVND